MNARRFLTALSVVAASVLLTATHATAATNTGVYFQDPTVLGTFQVLRTGNLVHVPVDDAVFGLSTTGSGANRLPFALHAYNQTYKNVVVSSNGNVQLGLTAGQANDEFTNDCLPTHLTGHPIVLPYWDDLFFIPGRTVAGAPAGIFVRTSGTAPHRTFLISWQGQENTTAAAPVLAQVLFREGSQTISFVYGTAGGASATIGVQSKEQLTQTQFACNQGSDVVGNGTDITFVHRNAI